MTDDGDLRARLARARALMAAGDGAEARGLLAALAREPGVGALGPVTAAGMPRRLHSAFLKLAKVTGDASERAYLRQTLVPPPGVLEAHTRMTPEQRRATAVADRKPVPRRMHQIWIGDRPPPPTTGAWAAHAERHGYAYRLWREADLAATGADRDPGYRAMRDAGDFPGAVDVARYLILAREGGVYLDCDWYPARDDISFHDRLPMIGLTAFAEEIPRETGMGSVLLANSFIATPPGHPVFARILAALPAVRAALPKGPAWWVTGPLIFTLAARGGTVSLADARIVAGAFAPGASSAEIQARAAANAAADGGLLFAWKPWG